MKQESEAAELREKIKAYRAKSPRGKLPDALQRRGKLFAKQRREQDASFSEIALELGVRPVTVQQWCTTVASKGPKRDETSLVPTLVPVLVNRKAAVPSQADRVEVELPNGVRLRATGLGEQGMESLLQTLGRLG